MKLSCSSTNLSIDVVAGMSPSQNGLQTNSTGTSVMQHHTASGRCSASGNATQQQTQPQQTQFGLGEPQR